MYFCTFTCYQWLNLFEITNSYDLVYKWFDYLKEKKLAEVVAYVIMPNHVHCILYFPHDQFDLNKIIGNAKRFMAYEIVKRLNRLDLQHTLQKLRNGLNAIELSKGQKLYYSTFALKWAVRHSPRLPYPGLCGAPRAAVARSHKPEMYRSIGKRLYMSFL